jgi:hypothetical protein
MSKYIILHVIVHHAFGYSNCEDVFCRPGIASAD